MDEVVSKSEAGRGGRLKQWLFNPFQFVAGSRALVFGLVVMLISGVFGWLGDTHFDGVLDLHTGMEAPTWLFFVEGPINWLCMAVPLYFFGLIVSRSSIRVVDVFGTQALARLPYLIAALVWLPDANRRFGEYLLSRFAEGSAAAAINYMDVLIFAFAMIVTVLMAIWMVVLMYRAYAVSCNIKGAKAVITFIVSLVGGEVLSKLAIMQLLT
jgi:hypothetical protein